MKRGEKWVPGVIIEKSGPYSFKVKTLLGIWRRHVDQMKLLIIDNTEDSGDATSIITPEFENTEVKVSTIPQTVSESEGGGIVDCEISTKDNDSLEVDVNSRNVEVEVENQEDVSSTVASGEVEPVLRRSSRKIKPVVKLNLYLN